MLNTFFDHFRRLNFQVLKDHCVKNVQIRSFFWSAFSYIRIEDRKIRTRKNSVFGLFSRSELNDNGDDKFRSSHPEVFLGKGVPKICRKLREHSCQSVLSIKLQSNWMAASISWLYISSQWRCSVKKGVLENYAIFTGKKLCWSLFLIKLLQQLRTAPSTYTISTIITLFRNFSSQLFQSQR